MKKNTLFYPHLVAAVCFLCIGFSSSAQNMAYIYRDSVLAATPGYFQAVNKMDSIKKSYGTEVDEANKQLNSKVNQLVEPYNIGKDETLEQLKSRMKPADLAQLELLIKENTFIEEKTKTYNLLYKQAFENSVQVILNNINKQIEQYSKANKIDFVLIMEELDKKLAYINTSKDITKEIKKLIVKMK
jgi:Skp family chaperone for outer membrane proteins